MSKKSCCCNKRPDFTINSFCCNPLFFTDFITLYGDSMVDHAEVSPYDWVGLVVNRPSMNATSYIEYGIAPQGCNCCCKECPPGPGDPGYEGLLASSSPKAETAELYSTEDLNGPYVPQELKSLYGFNKRSSNLKLNQGSKRAYKSTENRKFGFATKVRKSNDPNGFLNDVRQYDPEAPAGNTFIITNTLTGSGENGGGGGNGNGPGGNIEPVDWEQDPCMDTPCLYDVGLWCSGERDPAHPGHTKCRVNCCRANRLRSRIKGTDNMYFAYKYSGCHLTWFPREFSFGKDPYVAQCNGFLTMRRRLCLDRDGNLFECNPGGGCNSLQLSQNSCNGFANQRVYAGANFGAGHSWQCYESNDFYRSLSLYYPCACAPVPHIHGGMRDSVFNRVNVRTTPGQMGYVAKMNPFSPPMLTMEEAGCCWCANAAAMAPSYDDFTKMRRNCYRNTYPNFDGQGKVPRAGGREACSPGANCLYWPGCDPSGVWVVAGNPRYKKSCYEWGISPYLLRVSSDVHKMAYEIWRHGRNGDYKHDFGETYAGLIAERYDILRDLKIGFRRELSTPTNLKEQYIGFVQLEHHFECYAYRSNDPNTIEIQALQSMCMMLIPPFERGYGGTYRQNGDGSFRWTPHKYDNVLWQARRSIPRRVMYSGSGIPLFHFDLVAMQSYCVKNPEIEFNGKTFDPVEFLQHYYRYFYGMTLFSGNTSCTEVGVPPEAPEHNFSRILDSYRYVTFWLEKMIEAGILRIKDHAIDIAKDTNDILAQGAYITNPETGEQEVIIDDDVGIECGGLSGYLDIMNLFGVSAGTRSVTPKMIKEKLLNPEGLRDKLDLDSTGNESFGSMRIFLPRRARLSTSIAKSGITGWGCTGAVEPGTTYDSIGLICPSYVNEQGGSLDIPDELNPSFNELENTAWELLNLQKIFTGLAGTFVLDRTGKIAFFGGEPSGGDPPIQCASFGMYTNSIQCIPWYLQISGLFTCENPDGCEPKDVVPQSPIYVPDGKVIDMAVGSPNLAVALVDFDRNGLGQACCLNELNQNPPYENSAFELGEADPQYQKMNSNGANTTVDPNILGYVCLQNEPWQVLPGPAGTTILGPRVKGVTTTPGGFYEPDGPRVQTYRLKSWGSYAVPIGTFSLAKQDALQYNFGYGTTAGEAIARGYIPELNPTDDPDGPRYPAANNWFVWQKIASGLAHFVAIDDMGGAFSTIYSDETAGQSPFKPLNYNDPYNDEYHGFESRFNYFRHIPRPGFILPELWTQDFYNSVTNGCSDYNRRVCSCSYEAQELGYCQTPDNAGGGVGGGGGAGGGGGGGGDDTNICFSQFVSVPYGTRTISRCADGVCPQIPGSTAGNTGECVIPDPLVFDKTCLLMGSLRQVTCGGGIQGAYSDTQPRYIDVSAGAFNTFLLTNENRVEGYGKYYQINENGEIIGPVVERIIDGEVMVGIEGITCFVPEPVQALAGDWQVLRGCTIYCEGVTHSPIVEAIYRPPSNGDVIQILKSSADYTICATKNNVIYVWGDASMVPNVYNPETYIPGTPGYTMLTIPGTNNQIITIKNIAVGINAFYIHYTITIPGTDFLSNKVYSYTRYNREDYNVNYPIHLQGKPIMDIGAGFGFGMVLYGDGVEAKTWDWNSFPEDHKKHQYKNFPNLPAFFRRDAFFHAIPGNWDYSKFLWGGNCCFSFNEADHPVLQIDTCAAQAYNIYTNHGFLNLNTNAGFTFEEVITGICSGAQASILQLIEGNQIKFSSIAKTFKLNEEIVGDITGSTASILAIIPPGNTLEFNRNLARSGHPEYTWMRTDYRRTTFQGFSKIRDISDPLQGGRECLPPGGVQVPGGAFGGVNVKYAACYADQGDCWSPGRPSGYAMVQGQKTPLPSCYRSPSDSCNPDVEVYIRGMVSTDPLHALNTAIGHVYSQPAAYRSGKDVFQKMDVYYAANTDFVGGGVLACASHNKSIVSYFKYCERHFYFGYDPETDVWDIYESPDIFRDTITNAPKRSFSLYGTSFCGVNYCENLGGNCLGDPFCGCGSTISTVYDSTFWGGGSMGAGYTSLIDYPKPGPSFFREDYVFYPTYVVQDTTIGFFLTANLCASLYPNDMCADCLPGGPLGNNANYILAYYGGPGAYTFRPPCVGTSIPFQFPGSDAPNMATMWDRNKHFNYLRRTLHPSEILSGPYIYCDGNTFDYDCPQGLCGFTGGNTGGVCGYIDPLVPPILGGSSIRRTFLNVLKDPRATNITAPWNSGQSNKWNPMCYESRSSYPHLGITLGDVQCFAGIADPRVGGNNVLLSGLDSGLNAFSIDATCILFECCPPPED